MGTTHCKYYFKQTLVPCCCCCMLLFVAYLNSLHLIIAISVLLCGLDNAGKTTALYRMKYNQYCETIPTIGFNCEKVKGKLGKSKDCRKSKRT